MKSDFGDILDKNTGILSIISGKGVYTSDDFTQILKLKFRWYTSVFLKKLKLNQFLAFKSQNQVLYFLFTSSY